MLGADSDEKKSVGSRISTMSNSMSYVQFSKLEETCDIFFFFILIYLLHRLFTFMQGFIQQSGTLPNGIVIFLQILTSLQWFMLPLRSSRISTFGFNRILINLGLYIDPSNYIRSQITLIILLIILALFIILTLILGLSVYMLQKQLGKVQVDLRNLTLIVSLIYVTIFQPLICIIPMKPLLCLFYKNEDTLPYNVQFCHSKLILILQIIGPIISALSLIVTFFLKMFVFESSMKNKSLLVVRKGLYEAWLLVFVGFWSSCCSILEQKWDILVGAAHTIIFLLLAFLVFLKLPCRRWEGNALLCSSLFVGASGGIDSLLLSGLEELGKRKLAVLGGILFYTLSICILIGMSIMGWKVAQWRCMKMWLVEGIYEQRQVKSLLEGMEQSFPNILSIQKGQRKKIFQGRGEESLIERSIIIEENNDTNNKQIDLENQNNNFKIDYLNKENKQQIQQTQYVSRKVLVGIIVKTGPNWKEQKIFRLARKQDIAEQQQNQNIQTTKKMVPNLQTKNEINQSNQIQPLLPGDKTYSDNLTQLMNNIEDPQNKAKFVSSSSKRNPSLSRSMELAQYKDAPLILESWPIIMKYFFKQWKYVEDIERALRFLEEDDLARNEEVLRLVGNIILTMIRKNRFKASAEAHLDYALFLRDYRQLPMRMATHLQKMKECYPSWTNRSIAFYCIKQFQQNAGLQQGTGGSGKTDDQDAKSSMSYEEKQQLDKGKEQYELGKGNMLRVWALLARRTIDVERVMFHASKAIIAGQQAYEIYLQILRLNPKNSNALRQFALLERDVYLNSKGAIEMLKQADIIEEQDQQLSIGGSIDNNADNDNEIGTDQFESFDKGIDSDWIDPSVGQGKGDKQKDKKKKINQLDTSDNSKSEQQNISTLQIGVSVDWLLGVRKSVGNETNQAQILSAFFLYSSIVIVALLFLISFIFIFTSFSSSNQLVNSQVSVTAFTMWFNTELDFYIYDFVLIATFQQKISQSILEEDYIDELFLSQEDQKAFADEVNTGFIDILHETYNQQFWWERNVQYLEPLLASDSDITDIRTSEVTPVQLVNLVEDVSNEILFCIFQEPLDIPEWLRVVQVYTEMVIMIPSILNEEMKHFTGILREQVVHTALVSQLVQAFCLSISSLVLIIGFIAPVMTLMYFVLKKRTQAVKLLCQITQKDAQRTYEQLDTENGSSKKRTGLKLKRLKSKSSSAALNSSFKSIKTSLNQSDTEHIPSRTSSRATKESAQSNLYSIKEDEYQTNNIKQNDIENIQENIQNDDMQLTINSIQSAQNQNNSSVNSQKPVMKNKTLDDSQNQTDETDEMQAQQQRRIEEAEEKLKKLRKNIIPYSINIRLIIGTLLVLVSIVPYFVIGFISMINLQNLASQSTINSYRDIVISQISQIVTLVAQGMNYTALSESAIYSSNKYNSFIFKNTSYIINYEYQKNVITELMNLLINIERRLQYGTNGEGINEIEPSGDAFVDSFNLPILQGMNTKIDEIMIANSECLYSPDIYDDFQELCDIPDRIGFLIPIPFNGLQQLITEYIASTGIAIESFEPGNVYEFDPDYFNIIYTSIADIHAAIEHISFIFIQLLEEHGNLYTKLTIGLFALAMILLIIISFALIAPIPQILVNISKISSQMELLAKINQIERIEWKEEMTTETHRLDQGHKMLIQTMMNVVDEVKRIETGPVMRVEEADKIILEQFDGLILVTAAHFADEEHLMNSFGFPAIARRLHLNAHVALFRKLLAFHELVTKVKQNQEQQSANDILIFFNTWITPHFTSMDLDLGIFLLDISQRGKDKERVSNKKNKQEKSVMDLNLILNTNPNLSQFVVPQSLDIFFNGPNANMQEKQQFDDVIERIQLKLTQNHR